ncbi:MAG: hypothetical protein Q8P45_00375 [Candidatus Harrisonbacteria bacterium]|nr:hypothetical protein [Candidatus Harrisonbacteria bacterium]
MRKNTGQLSLQVLITGFVGIIVLSGFVVWMDAYVNSVLRADKKSLAFAIAEAGIEYSRWHLAHDPEDFQDGTGQDGPYIHDYEDKNGVKIGEFELDITPPESNTIVTIRSTGRLLSDPGLEKIIEVKMGLPSLGRFSVIGNSDLRFGEGTQVYGQMHSNGGIRFDGVAYNIITSAKEEYNDPDHSGNKEFGVHTHVDPADPLPPNAVPVRNDVFKAGREFPVPAVDFAGFTQDLAEIKAAAEDEGFYQDSSNKEGYHIVLKIDDTFDLYEVTKLVKAPQGCPASQKNWGTWSIDTESFLGNYDVPDNGLIFIEDHVWVDGTVDGVRLTIAAAKLPDIPAKRKSIIVNNDLSYTNTDGSDVVALIAQEDFQVGLISEDDLEIDAAIIAQNGRAGRSYYKSQCGLEYERDTITLYGMLATNQRYGFAYTDGTGYQTRIISYDGNLLFNPPPGFPITAEQYEIISWKEIK